MATEGKLSTFRPLPCRKMMPIVFGSKDEPQGEENKPEKESIHYIVAASRSVILLMLVDLLLLVINILLIILPLVDPLYYCYWLKNYFVAGRSIIFVCPFNSFIAS